MVLLSHQTVRNAWRHVKRVGHDAWHKGHKLAGTIDKYADLGLRLFGATASLLPQKAVQMGLEGAARYKDVRQKTLDFSDSIDRVTNRVRQAAPELGI